MFIGPPGSGKSTYFRKILYPLGYEHISQHALGSQDRCVEVANELLTGGKPVGTPEGYANDRAAFSS